MRTSTPTPKTDTDIGHLIRSLARSLEGHDWIEEIEQANDNDVSLLVTLRDSHGRTKTALVRIADATHAQSVRQAVSGKKVIVLFTNMGRKFKHVRSRILNDLQPYRFPRRKRIEKRSNDQFAFDLDD